MVKKRQPASGGFVFEPRSVIDGRKQFGQSSMSLAPAEGVALTDPRYLAALLQHRVANTVRESLLAENMSVQTFAESDDLPPGMSYDRLVRIQRGETLMQLADLLNWASRFEPVRRMLAAEQFGYVAAD